jgi:hypothetical protein
MEILNIINKPNFKLKISQIGSPHVDVDDDFIKWSGFQFDQCVPNERPGHSMIGTIPSSGSAASTSTQHNAFNSQPKNYVVPLSLELTAVRLDLELL